MVSNLSTIGFTFADEAQFQASMARLVANSVARLTCPGGEYAIWRSRAGAELWFHLPPEANEAGDERTVIGLTPWFEGASSVPMKLTRVVKRAEDNALEGGFQAWVGPDDSGEGSYPLILDAVDFAAHATRPLPAVRTVRLTAFVREMSVYATAAEHAAAASGPVPLAAEAFLPLGLFAAAADETKSPDTASANAMLTGRILEARSFENEETGRNFYWLLVRSLDMTLDVIADPDAVRGTIAEGGTVELTCWLAGRILD